MAVERAQFSPNLPSFARSLPACLRARKLFLQRGFAARDLLRKVSINRAEFALSNCSHGMTNDIANAPETNFFLARRTHWFELKCEYASQPYRQVSPPKCI
jgi:hypothetical protein